MRHQLLAVAPLIAFSASHPAPSPLETASQELLRHSLIITPGPGLPSLKELGIVAADLLPDLSAEQELGSTHRTSSSDSSSSSVDAVHTLSRRFTPKCYKTNGAKLQLARACQNYLNQISGQSCVAKGGWAYMCNATAGDEHAFVRGRPDSVAETSALCGNVAKGMDWLFDHCPKVGCDPAKDCLVAGENAAFANGNLVFEIVGSDAL